MICPDEYDPAVLEQVVRRALEDYKATLSDDRRALLDRFVAVDIAVKVVGVGSVGTRCLIILFVGRDGQDPLFLQVKEAGRIGARADLRAERVRQPGPAGRGGPASGAGASPTSSWGGPRAGAAGSSTCASCATGRARSRSRPRRHPRAARLLRGSVRRDAGPGPCPLGRSGRHPAYAGKSATLDRAITDFAEAYAAQNLEDFARFEPAIGRPPGVRRADVTSTPVEGAVGVTLAE